ncbi:HEAT repeat domain-containing protein [Psychromicrobium sp. YIM B11713]|uniref:HEAT repeat domain-containing protein n=1 Tax=Psychromicrobium sp. YIM B11713 TaxID=3145233 RepID=UPI00374F70FC
MTHPSVLIEQGLARYGYEPMIEGIITLLHGEIPEIDIHTFAGTTGWKPYWLPTWGARACLYLWHEDCVEPVVEGLSSEFWRVREMCAKVCRYREIGTDQLSPLLTDQVPRVRAAAARALGQVGEAEHAKALKDLKDDVEAQVQRAAQQAVQTLESRLERSFD